MVHQISPDTVRDEADPKQIYYRVYINTEKSQLAGPTGNLSILPGMIAEVDIQTGRRTVLEYFLKPLTRAQVTALMALMSLRTFRIRPMQLPAARPIGMVAGRRPTPK